MSEMEILDGWKKTKINDMIKLIPQTNKKIKKQDYNRSGILPIIDQGKNHIGGYTDDLSRVIQVKQPLIIFGDHTRSVKYVDVNFVPGADGIKILKINEEIIPKYFYYFLKSIKLENKGYSRHFKFLKEYSIIFPEDKNLQNRIVKKLDYLLEKIEEKKKEIFSRIEKFDSKKINETFKNHLLKLAFDGTLTNEQFIEINAVKIPKNWELLTLPQIVKNEKYAILRGPFGGSLKKEIFKDKGYLVYEQYHAIHDDFSMARYFIDEKKFNEMKRFKVTSGDMIISCSGVTMGRIAQIPENAHEGIINQALLKISLDPRIINHAYFKFLFRSDMIQKIIFGISRGTGMPNFPSLKEIKSILFPIPPIETQEKIVQILHKKFEDWENHKQEIQNIEKRHLTAKQHISDLLFSVLNDAFTGKLVN